jgi:hypothetical protein
MARIRSVHPDLPSDRKLAGVVRDARYTYVLCWCIADDAGFFRAEPRQLLGQLYPHDPDVTEAQLEAWLVALVGLGVLRWQPTRDGARVGQLVNWRKRQKIDKPSRSFLEGELRPLAEGSRGPGEHLVTDERAGGEQSATHSRAESISLEPRALSTEPRADAVGASTFARVSRATELLARLPTSAHDALEGYLRAAQDPAAVVATILAEGPDTGTNAGPGKTWAHVGQALLDMRAASEPFKPLLFRAFVSRLVRQRDAPSGEGGMTEAERMDQLAVVERGKGTT